MALHLILRNSAKFQGVNSAKNLLNITPRIAIAHTNLIWTKNSNNLVQNMNRNLLSATRRSDVIATPQIRFSSGDHSKIWPVEKLLSAALLGIVPLTLLFPNPALDAVFATSIVAHFHWGLEAVVVDYVRPILFGNFIPKLALGLLYLVSISTLGGLLYYSFNDAGIAKTITKLWYLKPAKPAEVAKEEAPKGKK